jgi:hypothetical protein
MLPPSNFTLDLRRFTHDNNRLVALADVPSGPSAARAWRRSHNGSRQDVPRDSPGVETQLSREVNAYRRRSVPRLEAWDQ